MAKGSDWVLVYYEAYRNESDAREGEHKVKNNGGTRHYLLKRIEKSRRFERRAGLTKHNFHV